jgi:hypothetical protein
MDEKIMASSTSLKGPDFPIEVDKKGLFDHVVSIKEKNYNKPLNTTNYCLLDDILSTW